MKNRAVVTGIGIVSPLGIGHRDFWNNLVAGNSGIAPMESLDLTGYECKNGAEVKGLKPEEFLGSRGLKYLNKGTRFLGSSVKLALDDADLDIDEELSSQTGILIGSSLGNFSQTTDYFHDIVRENPSELSPMQSYDVALNSSINYTSVVFRMKNFARTVSSGFTSSTDAIGNAFKLIQNGKANVIVTGGVEQISLDLYIIFYMRKMLAGTDGTGRETSMPFDERRNGFIMGEGSYVFVLENRDHALSRGAKIYGEVSGYGSVFSGGRSSNIGKRVEKARNAMYKCISDAGMSVDSIDLINANGNSGILSDLIEIRAVRELFGEKCAGLQVHSVKSSSGECYGASGAMQTASALLSISHGLIPPTINCEEKDPECNLNIVNESLEKDITTVLINSFDLSGNNSCLVVRKSLA